MVVNAALAVGLAPVVGWFAPAIATSVAAWVMVALLRQGARSFGEVVTFDARFHRRIWRIIAAAIVMGAAVWITGALLNPFLGLPWWRVIALIALIGVACLTYFGSAQLFGAFRLAEFRSAMRRGG